MGCAAAIVEFGTADEYGIKPVSGDISKAV
jgi:hypothetical protein